MAIHLQRSLLKLSKGKSLLDITYAFLLITSWAHKQPKKFSTVLTIDPSLLRTNLMTKAGHFWIENGLEAYDLYINRIQDKDLFAICQLVKILEHNYNEVEHEIRMLMLNHNKRLNLSYTPQSIKQLLQTIVSLYLDTSIHLSLYDFNARSGDLLSDIATTLPITPQKLCLEESNSLMQQIGWMFFALKYDEHEFSFANRNSLTDSTYVLTDQKFDGIFSYPKLSMVLDQEESSLDKPYLCVSPDSQEKIHSPEALSVQLANSLLNEQGVAFILVSESFLNRQGYDLKLRKYLIENDLVDTIISLPNNLYPGTTLSTSILILNQTKQVPSQIKLLNLSKNRLSKKDIAQASQILKGNTDLHKEGIFTKIDKSQVDMNNFSLRTIDYTFYPTIEKNSLNIEVQKEKLSKALNNYHQTLDSWEKS